MPKFCLRQKRVENTLFYVEFGVSKIGVKVLSSIDIMCYDILTTFGRIKVS